MILYAAFVSPQHSDLLTESIAESASVLYTMYIPFSCVYIQDNEGVTVCQTVVKCETK